MTNHLDLQFSGIYQSLNLINALIHVLFNLLSGRTRGHLKEPNPDMDIVDTMAIKLILVALYSQPVVDGTDPNLPQAKTFPKRCELLGAYV